jgi:hypothetical protein
LIIGIRPQLLADLTEGTREGVFGISYVNSKDWGKNKCDG